MEPDLIEIRRADYLTIGTIGEPGHRTFFLQAAQDDLVVSLVIEKQQATALAIGISNVLADAGAVEDVDQHERMELIHPIRPLFRVGRLSLGQDEGRNMFVIVARALVAENEPATTVRIWGTRDQMLALSREAIIAVASGRPLCPLCHEIMDPDEEHICVRGNGRKHI